MNAISGTNPLGIVFTRSFKQKGYRSRQGTVPFSPAALFYCALEPQFPAHARECFRIDTYNAPSIPL